MNQHHHIKALIRGVQEGEKIQAIKAVRALLIGDGEATYREGERLSVEMQLALALVRKAWKNLPERPAYMMGQYNPVQNVSYAVARKLERNNGEPTQKEKEEVDDRPAKGKAGERQGSQRDVARVRIGSL